MKFFITLLFPLSLALPGPLSYPDDGELPFPLDFKREDSTIEALEERTVIEKTVYDPHITDPAQGTAWKAGDDETVKWDTSSLPSSYDGTGTLLLGYIDPSSPGEHLMIDSPLATGFLLTDGSKTITLPSNLTTKSTYIVVLMGDSGNASPEFTINAASSSTSNSQSSTSSSTNLVGSDGTFSASTPTTITGPITIPFSIATPHITSSTSTSQTVASTTLTTSVPGSTAVGSNSGSTSSGNRSMNLYSGWFIMVTGSCFWMIL